ncbi:MAG: NAD(P)-dependent oxidoreductase [Deltaproteobacteria bacterium]|nr:NAD(P)-dependent oxidoreductase [Deltaproteobacteria bacterium]
MPVSSTGVIGVGTMGGALAGHLLEKGHAVTVYDIKRALVEPLGKRGARLAQSPMEVAANSDLTLIVVVDDAQVKEVCLGHQGVLEGARPGSVVAICSTVQPATCREVGQAAHARSVHVLDTPMLRGVWAAVEGKLLLMVGGDARVLEQCRPAFAAFASDVCHLGELGSGQVGKIVNNLILWACLIASREGLGLARSQGMDLGVLRDALLRSSADNFALREWGRVSQQPKWWDQKDLKGVLELAEESQAPVPIAAMVKELIKGFGPKEARDLLPHSA